MDNQRLWFCKFKLDSFIKRIFLPVTVNLYMIVAGPPYYGVISFPLVFLHMSSVSQNCCHNHDDTTLEWLPILLFLYLPGFQTNLVLSRLHLKHRYITYNIYLNWSNSVYYKTMHSFLHAFCEKRYYFESFDRFKILIIY